MQNQPFRSIVGFLAMGAVVIAGVAWLVIPPTAQSAPTTGESALEMPEDDNPTLILKGVRATVVNNGLMSQEVGAERAQLTLALEADQTIKNLEQSKKTLDLTDLHITFYENGAFFAGGSADSGRLWLDDQPELDVHGNDAVLEGNVDFKLEGGLRFQTGQIRYSRQFVRLWSDMPVKMYKHGGGGSDIVSQGTGFIVELIPGTTDVKTFQLFGGENERGSIRAVREEKLETLP